MDVPGIRYVYTDGACSNNQNAGSRLAGVGVWFGSGCSDNVSRRPYGKDTNNQAEIEGLRDAVAIIHQNRDPKGLHKWVIRTDSMYAKNCVTKFFPSWLRRGGLKADGQPAVHFAITKEIVGLLERRKDVGEPIEIEHVRREFNADADALAKAACGLERQPTGKPEQGTVTEPSTTTTRKRHRIGPMTLGVFVSKPVACVRAAANQAVRMGMDTFGSPSHMCLAGVKPRFLDTEIISSVEHVAVARTAAELVASSTHLVAVCPTSGLDDPLRRSSTLQRAVLDHGIGASRLIVVFAPDAPTHA